MRRSVCCLHRLGAATRGLNHLSLFKFPEPAFWFSVLAVVLREKKEMDGSTVHPIRKQKNIWCLRWGWKESDRRQEVLQQRKAYKWTQQHSAVSAKPNVSLSFGCVMALLFLCPLHSYFNVRIVFIYPEPHSLHNPNISTVWSRLA